MFCKRWHIEKIVLLLLLGAALFALPALRVRQPFVPEPVYFVEGSPPAVALTFENRWSSDGLDELLQLLWEAEVKATFFITGHWLEQNLNAVQMILNHDHELGNHTLSHRLLPTLNREDLQHELAGFNDLCQELLGYRPRLFRPPHGAYNGIVLEEAAREELVTVLWSVESYDSISSDCITIINRLSERMHGGAVISFRVGAPGLNEALPEIINLILEQGYKPVTVSELLDSADI